MAKRKISGFRQDDEQHFVAELECGHTQHMRHRPPLESREWVMTAAGRQEKLESVLECPYCDMPELPSAVIAYKRTPEFDENTVPEGLLRDHRTRPGVWGRIVVLEGLLKYETFEPAGVWVLRPGVDGFISPGARHRVSPCGHVRFFVEFLR